MSSNYLTWYLSFDCDRIIIEIQKYNLEHILFTRENKSTISEDLNFNSNGIITTSYPDATLSSLSGNKEKVIFNKQAEKLKSRKMKNKFWGIYTDLWTPAHILFDCPWSHDSKTSWN